MTLTRDIIIYAVVIIFGVILATHLNVVVSGSMEPVFYRGDIVAIEPTNFFGILGTLLRLFIGLFLKALILKDNYIIL